MKIAGHVIERYEITARNTIPILKNSEKVDEIKPGEKFRTLDEKHFLNLKKGEKLAVRRWHPKFEVVTYVYSLDDIEHDILHTRDVFHKSNETDYISYHTSTKININKQNETQH